MALSLVHVHSAVCRMSRRLQQQLSGLPPPSQFSGVLYFTHPLQCVLHSSSLQDPLLADPLQIPALR